ncbi:hypothetical protein MARPO_0032s0101 [Marchantia polymorpha]|uniref:Uncharacterized protein n=1 Tax=Marchantia polymorpha TaxID=3197 RepID=A0A2R6X749_MARPO|nr:hypothetical protein MARPO_0032s0101 [Marchantia polymorpha]|eukprot:PTQ41919.1 hypothetical protein MARPO_0032s0101 [Marchantia polymorpha]
MKLCPTSFGPDSSNGGVRRQNAPMREFSGSGVQAYVSARARDSSRFALRLPCRWTLRWCQAGSNTSLGDDEGRRRAREQEGRAGRGEDNRKEENGGSGRGRGRGEGKKGNTRNEGVDVSRVCLRRRKGEQKESRESEGGKEMVEGGGGGRRKRMEGGSSFWRWRTKARQVEGGGRQQQLART